MSYRIENRYVPSSDGIHTLSGKLYLPTGEKPRGLFHLVHGMCEYIDRFDGTMSALAEAGYICFGFDNLGHGKTASEGELGFIAERDGWRYLVEDVKRFENDVCAEYTDLPLALMGHSMGSFIARLAAEKYGDDIQRLIICGTGGPNPAAPFGLLLTDIMALIKGKRGYSTIAQNAAFGAYNKRFEGRTEYDWLTKDNEIIDRYIKDSFCNFPFTISALHDLVKLCAECNRGEWFKALRKDMPVLLISGEDDPVGNYGKGVRAVYKGLKACGQKDVTLRLYKNCRHEIHNDTCAAEVLDDIKRFIG